MDYKKEMENALSHLESKGFDRRTIEKKLGYAENYIDQALSKGGNAKVIKKLQALAEGPSPLDVDMGIAMRKTQAICEIILSTAGEILAKNTGTSVTVVQEQLETLVRKRINNLEF